MTPEEILERIVVALERIADALEGEQEVLTPLERIADAVEGLENAQ